MLCVMVHLQIPAEILQCNYHPICLRICNVILNPPSPQLDPQQIEHQSMETARHHICIYHVILFGLGQEFDLHLPLQCNSEFPTRNIKLVCHHLC